MVEFIKDLEFDHIWDVLVDGRKPFGRPYILSTEGRDCALVFPLLDVKVDVPDLESPDCPPVVLSLLAMYGEEQ